MGEYVPVPDEAMELIRKATRIIAADVNSTSEHIASYLEVALMDVMSGRIEIFEEEGMLHWKKNNPSS